MKICCCDGEVSDDEEMLVDDEDDDGQNNIVASRDRISRYVVFFGIFIMYSLLFVIYYLL